MEHVSNEQKAKEIAKSNGINYKNHSKYEDDMDSTLECYKSALEAMQWKDEVHAKEKQEWIDKVGEWINDNYFEYLQPISYYEQLQNSIDINDFVNDLKKAMKGE